MILLCFIVLHVLLISFRILMWILFGSFVKFHTVHIIIMYSVDLSEKGRHKNAHLDYPISDHFQNHVLDLFQ